MWRRPSTSLIALVFCASIVVACEPSAAPRSCVTGFSIACSCPDGRMGAQVCQADGTYGPCACMPDGDGGTELVDSEDGPPWSDGDGPDICAHDVALFEGNAAEVARCRIILGNLDIESGGEVHLASLERVEGQLTSSALLLQVISLPALVYIGSNFDLRGLTALRTVELPMLGTIGGELHVESCGVLSTVDLSALNSVGGEGATCTISDLPLLTDLRLDGLRSLNCGLELARNSMLTGWVVSQLDRIGGDLLIHDNPALATIGLPRLLSLGGRFTLENMAALSSANVGSVETVGGSVRVDRLGALGVILLGSLSSVNGSIEVTSNSALTSLTLPVLVDLENNLAVVDNDALLTIRVPRLTTLPGNLRIADHAMLTELAVPGLRSVSGTVHVANNPVLPACAARGLTMQVGRLPGDPSVDVTGNDESAVCP